MPGTRTQRWQEAFPLVETKEDDIIKPLINFE
ncbi:hypothetical protein HISP_17440 [Haloarcula hispanica N601]|uniref:Uncharacterized protein n=1 Tax=Haloarcula hispanica N601 TaxID=1417673 RepID=V5TRC8_HALHI|nr:hypothetical protein HISP_17440 [Haloarcula hispanica N601]